MLPHFDPQVWVLLRRSERRSPGSSVVERVAGWVALGSGVLLVVVLAAGTGWGCLL